MTIHPPLKKDHFHGRTALRHIAEEQSKEASLYGEVHGAQMSGSLFTFFDSFRETVIIFVMGLLVFDAFELLSEQKVIVTIGFFVGWCSWKGMKGAYLAWSRLRRMHAIALEEKGEIESNRPQEREELVALYGAKGFSGPLLETVVDVLMADQERLLRVMLQEEMGFRLEEHSHPIIQGFCAVAGVVCSLLLFLPIACGLSLESAVVGSIICIGSVGAVSARLEKDCVIAAFLWNGMMTAVTYMFVHVCVEILAK